MGKRDLVFATRNKGKANEIQLMLPEGFRVLTAAEAGFDQVIEETGKTFRDNALLKALTVCKVTGLPVFADDSGLQVKSLDGQPGVYSSRFAGPAATDQENIEKLLADMKEMNNREACFKTVIALVWESQHFFFEGICEGAITTTPSGNNGFGYDPVFIPKGCNQTFASMQPHEKAAISHRAKAFQGMVTFLSSRGI